MQGQRLIEATSQVPPSDAAREDIHDDGQVHKLLTQSDGGDVAHPDLRRHARSPAARLGLHSEGKDARYWLSAASLHTGGLAAPFPASSAGCACGLRGSPHVALG